MQDLRTHDYADLKPLFPICFHLLCLIYSNSKYYCKPVRIITLMREICNLIIERTIKYLDSSTIFQIEPEEAKEKVAICFQTMKQFKSTFKEFKESLPSYFKNGKPKYWTFKVSYKKRYISYRKYWRCS